MAKLYTRVTEYIDRLRLEISDEPIVNDSGFQLNYDYYYNTSEVLIAEIVDPLIFVIPENYYNIINKIRKEYVTRISNEFGPLSGIASDFESEVKRKIVDDDTISFRHEVESTPKLIFGATYDKTTDTVTVDPRISATLNWNDFTRFIQAYLQHIAEVKEYRAGR